MDLRAPEKLQGLPDYGGEGMPGLGDYEGVDPDSSNLLRENSLIQGKGEYSTSLRKRQFSE
jgi:hypothetical protein